MSMNLCTKCKLFLTDSLNGMCINCEEEGDNKESLAHPVCGRCSIPINLKTNECGCPESNTLPDDDQEECSPQNGAPAKSAVDVSVGD